jgi:6-phosphofructokinase 1
MATRLAAKCVEYLEGEVGKEEPASACIGLVNGHLRFTDLLDVPRLMDKKWGRPREQWWMNLRPILRVLAQPAPRGTTGEGG